MTYKMHKQERPFIPNIVQKKTTQMEYFQNKVLRPIIKMQHNLLILSFKEYLKKRKIEILHLAEKKKMDRIDSIFRKDLVFKNLILGFVIGHFSLEEYAFYSENASEIHKRTHKIIQKRIQDSLREILLDSE